MNRQRTRTLGNFLGKSHETESSKIITIEDKTVDTTCSYNIVGKSPYLTDSLDLPFQDESTLDISPCQPSRKLSKANLSYMLPYLASMDNTSFHNPERTTSMHTTVEIETEDEETASCTSSSISSAGSSWCSSSDCSVGKKVRFRVDEYDEIDEEIGILSFPRHDLTPHDKGKAWWSKMERRQMKRSVPNQCEYAMYKHPTYRRVAFKVIAMLNHTSMEDLEEKLSDPNQHHSALREALPILVHTDSRGLERAMMKRLQLPRADVRAHVWSVLQHQQSLQFVHSLSEDEKQQLLAEEAASNSELARKWALVIAQGDVEAVHNNDDDHDDDHDGDDVNEYKFKSRAKRIIHFL